jgi:hypothetical protein
MMRSRRSRRIAPSLVLGVACALLGACEGRGGQDAGDAAASVTEASSSTAAASARLAASSAASAASAAAQPIAWRADCPPVIAPAPLSLEAAREAHRQAARRHELRLREAADPGSFLRSMSAALDHERMARGEVCLTDVADLGQLVFEHEYGFVDGLGSGGAARDVHGPFRRVHGDRFGGPETISCPSCHWIGGPSGAGAETDDAFLMGDGEQPGSGDARNPPALVAPGVVQALAREMTRDLQRQRDTLLRGGGSEPGRDTREVRLTSKGVDFGVLRVDANGMVDASGLQGIDADLVVKPFGWKGTLATIADFSAEALQLHTGVQTDALVARGDPEMLRVGAGAVGRGSASDPTVDGDHDGDPSIARNSARDPSADAADPDGDGIRDELRRGPFDAMVAHLALLELPIVAPLVQDRALPPAAPALLAPTTTSFAEDFRRGREHFHALGCASCHVPMMTLDSPMLQLDGLPPIDLSHAMRAPRVAYDDRVAGYPVWLFSDLKRHDMGIENAARHVQNGVGERMYLTPRLWGVADSAPYLHDGRAPSLDYAIAGHGGEGAAARAAYAALPHQEQGALRVYLMSLRRAPRVVVP